MIQYYKRVTSFTTLIRKLTASSMFDNVHVLTDIVPHLSPNTEDCGYTLYVKVIGTDEWGDDMEIGFIWDIKNWEWIMDAEWKVRHVIPLIYS